MPREILCGLKRERTTAPSVYRSKWVSSSSSRAADALFIGNFMNTAFDDLTLVELTQLAHAVVTEDMEISEQEGKALLEILSTRQAEVRYLEHLKALE